MFKVNKYLTKTVKKILNQTNIKVLTYEELETQTKISDFSQFNIENNKTLSVSERVIAISDHHLQEANELILYAVVSKLINKFNLGFKANKGVNFDTQKATAWMGTYKIIEAFGANPAEYEVRAYKHLKELKEADFDTAELDSDKLVDYLVVLLNLDEVA